MSVYFAYIKIAFLNKCTYRVECLLGILSTCLQIFISCAIWKVLYGTNQNINDITYSMVVTNFVLSQGLSKAFSVNDFAIQQKINDGTICNEFLKPVDYRISILATNLGEILFNLIAFFLPTVLITSIFIGILPPSGLINFLLFLLSIILGFIILWLISSIVQMSSFWIINVWSISTIKNVIIGVLSGSLLPLWFMPESVLQIIKYTPFDSIYFIPIEIYLETISLYEIMGCYVRQVIWIIILYSLSRIMWKFGKKRLVVQGG